LLFISFNGATSTTASCPRATTSRPIRGFLGRGLLLRGFLGRGLLLRGFLGRGLLLRGFLGRGLLLRGFLGRGLLLRGFLGRGLLIPSYRPTIPNVLRRAATETNVQNGIQWFGEFNSRTANSPLSRLELVLFQSEDSLAIKIENVSVSVGRAPFSKPLTLRVVLGFLGANSQRSSPAFVDEGRCEPSRDYIRVASH